MPCWLRLYSGMNNEVIVRSNIINQSGQANLLYWYSSEAHMSFSHLSHGTLARFHTLIDRNTRRESNVIYPHFLFRIEASLGLPETLSRLHTLIKRNTVRESNFIYRHFLSHIEARWGLTETLSRLHTLIKRNTVTESNFIYCHFLCHIEARRDSLRPWQDFTPWSKETQEGSLFSFIVIFSVNLKKLYGDLLAVKGERNRKRKLKYPAKTID